MILWFHQRLDQTRQSRTLLHSLAKQERHRNAGYHILVRGGRNEKGKIFGLGSHSTACGDVFVASSCGAPPTAAPTEPPAQEPTERQQNQRKPRGGSRCNRRTDRRGTERSCRNGNAVVITGGELSPDIPEPAEPVTVTWATWIIQNPPFWQATIAAFEEIHPNITIEVQSVPNEEMFDKFLTQIAAGNPPDTAYVSDWMTGARCIMMAWFLWMTILPRARLSISMIMFRHTSNPPG